MLKNYVLIAWRNFVRHRTFSLINILGFSLAMASCFLIVFHIRNETSYEKNFPKYERIYRIHLPEWAKSSPPMAGALLDYYPEIEGAARFYSWNGNIFSYEDFRAPIRQGFLADSSAIDIFDLEFIQGSPDKSLRVPYTIVITESMAKKFFNNEEAIGKTIRMDDRTDYAITGVIRDLPENTHLKFEYLVSFTTFYQAIPENWTSNKGWMAPYTYILVAPGKIDDVLAKCPEFLQKFYEGQGSREEIAANTKLEFQPLKDIHLHSNLEQEMGPNSNAGYLYIFAAVGVFIIFIASVNFINLNISLSFRRMKETGMRKVMGAFRMQLVRQYLTETVLLSVFSFIIALALFFAVLPNYNALSGRDVKPGDLWSMENIGVMAALILIVSLISGLYPALFVSGFKPIDSLKTQKDPKSSTSFVRKMLVVFQFSVSVFMIASTIIIYRQMNFFHSTALGFDKDEIVAVNLYGDLEQKFESDQEVVKSALRKNPEIVSVGACSNLPGDNTSVEQVVPVGADPQLEFPQMRVIRAEYDLIPTLRLELTQGRNFAPGFNDSSSFIINESAAKALNLTEPIGAMIINSTMNRSGKVVGVLRDFHFTSLHNAIEPMVIEYKPEWTGQLLIKMNTRDKQATLKHIENSLKEIAPSNIFSYTFVDERWDMQYREENKMSTLFNAFSLFMISISCIGLFGLSAIAIETRKKEIGIRKVLGASTATILRILSKEFVIMVFVGAAIALPLAWYAMNTWLQKFVFKISITTDVFIISLAMALVVALTAVLVNALRAARRNPVDSLRNE